MKYTRWSFCFVALILGTAQLPLLAQSPYVATTGVALPAVSTNSETDQSGNPVLTIKKRVDEVNVLFIATDRHGKFVRNLNQRDFTILDDHKPPQAIVNFRREVDLPLDLGLLIDVSGSVNSRFDFEQNAATSFLQHTIRARFDKAFIVGFNAHSHLEQDFTDSVPLLSAAVHRMHDGGGTAL